MMQLGIGNEMSKDERDNHLELSRRGEQGL